MRKIFDNIDSKNIIHNAIIAGILIGVSDYIYMFADNKIVAAFIFPIALITILKVHANLFTGKIGIVKNELTSVISIIEILIGNMIGLLPLLFIRNTDYVQSFLDLKLSVWNYDVFIKAFVCGMLMYLAVTYPGENYLGTILCVSGFLIGKCEHSIADIGFIYMAKDFSNESINFITLVILGNSLGAIFLNHLMNKNLPD